MTTIELDHDIGSHIDDAIRNAIEKAKEIGGKCRFEFNGVTVTVAANSIPSLIYRDWSRALNGYIEKDVGPYPSQDLTAAELEHDAEIARQNEERAKRQRELYESKSAKKKAELYARLASAPPLELRDDESWENCKRANSGDSYGWRCCQYAEDLARLLQLRMANGDAMEDCLDEESHAADHDGISGFMFGAAMSMLTHVWAHGDELDRIRKKERDND